MEKIINYKGKDLFVELGTYPNGRLAILLNTSDGELWDDLTINLPNKELKDNEIYINPRIDNKLLDKLCDTGVFLNSNRIDDYTYRILYVNKNLLQEYAKNYKIEIWETEEDRNQGYGFVYDETFNNFENALATARHLYRRNDFASIEVLDEDDEAYFCKDSDGEEFYLNNERICKVSNEVVDLYIDNWLEHKKLPTTNNKIYCKMNIGGYLAVDNSSGECYVEEFYHEMDALDWLSNKMEKCTEKSLEK